MTVTNAQISELLARRAEEAEGHRARALRRAARAAMTWPEEAAAIVSAGRSLTELYGVGPRIEGAINAWLDDPPEPVEPPPLRAGFLTVARARRVLADHTEWRTYVRGDLQMHTVYSDGAATLEQMAHAGIDMGYEYFAITDHSKELKIAGGMDERALARQGDEIARLNSDLALEGHDFELLKSLEMNLRPDGSGDMDPDALDDLDLVLGSFHSQLRTTADQADRYLAAIGNPHVNVLGHPRGRKFNFRLGLQADWERVFAEAVRRGTALEIDCFPDRQDLDVELLKLANEAGAFFSIGTDAHDPYELGFFELGLAAAIEAGIPQERILNFAPADAVRAWGRHR